MKAIYLEPDEEITSVIEKISASSEESLAVVVPKNSTLFQSMVNLKLLLKQSRSDNKKISLITTNKVGARLAREIGLPVYANLGNVPKVAEPVVSSPKSQERISEELPEGIKVNRYIPPSAGDPQRPTEDNQIEESVLSSRQEEEKKGSSISLQSVERLSDDQQPISDHSEPVSLSREAPQEEPRQISPAQDPTDLPAVARRFGNFPKTHLSFHFSWKTTLVIASLLLIALLSAILFIPKAKVNIILPSVPISEKLILTASITKSSQADHLIANQITVTKQGEATVAASGKKNIGTKAKGVISITNKYRDSSGVGKDQTFAQGTIATDTKTKKTFILNSSVTVGRVTFNPDNGSPIYQTKNVEVTATQAGEDYNLSPSTFTLQGELPNTVVESVAPFSGGTSKEVTVLSQGDVDKAVAELKGQLLEQAKSEISTKSKGQKLLSEAMSETIKENKIDAAIDAQVDSAKLKLALEVSALVFNEDEAKKIIINKMNEKVAANQQLTIASENQPAFTFKEFNADKTAFTFEVSASGNISERIANNTIARQISNKTTASAINIVKENYKAESVEIDITPSWWIDRTPLLSGMISIEVSFKPVGNQ